MLLIGSCVLPSRYYFLPRPVLPPHQLADQQEKSLGEVNYGTCGAADGGETPLCHRICHIRVICGSRAE